MVLFSTIRIVLFGAPLIALLRKYYRNKKAKRRRKSVAVLMAIAAFALLIVSEIFPPESLFLSFPTPEQAFRYQSIGSIETVIIGDDSAFVYYRASESVSSEAIPRRGAGWGIALPPNYSSKTETISYAPLVSLSVYNPNGTDDYYIEVFQSDPLHKRSVTVTDSNGSQFGRLLQKYSVVDYTVLKGLPEGYQVIIGDKMVPVTWEDMKELPSIP
ncbi:MAG: hypothetical protein FWD72_05910 [Eggerthellaceae bacterium]|nr:hypothetical protein [Eggerthellaceae bacterium]